MSKHSPKSHREGLLCKPLKQIESVQDPGLWDQFLPSPMLTIWILQPRQGLLTLFFHHKNPQRRLFSFCPITMVPRLVIHCFWCLKNSNQNTLMKDFQWRIIQNKLLIFWKSPETSVLFCKNKKSKKVHLKLLWHSAIRGNIVDSPMAPISIRRQILISLFKIRLKDLNFKWKFLVHPQHWAFYTL